MDPVTRNKYTEINLIEIDELMMKHAPLHTTQSSISAINTNDAHYKAIKEHKIKVQSFESVLGILL